MSVGEIGETELPHNQGNEGEVNFIEEMDSFLTKKIKT